MKLVVGIQLVIKNIKIILFIKKHMIHKNILTIKYFHAILKINFIEKGREKKSK